MANFLQWFQNFPQFITLVMIFSENTGALNWGGVSQETNDNGTHSGWAC